MTATLAANVVILNRQTEVWAMTERTAAPFRTGSVAEAAAVLGDCGADEVVVEFSTMTQFLEADLKVYGKRLAKLAALTGRTATPFAPKVVRGVSLPGVYAATLSK